jgi:hypothetical protein
MPEECKPYGKDVTGQCKTYAKDLTEECKTYAKYLTEEWKTYGKDTYGKDVTGECKTFVTGDRRSSGLCIAPLCNQLNICHGQTY